MGVLDDCKFIVNGLIARINRVAKAATDCEAAPTDKSKKLLKVMAERIDGFYDTFHENILKIAQYNAKNNIQEDLDASYIKQFEDAYFNIKSIVAITLEEEDAAGNVSQPLINLTGSGGSTSHIQLPKLKLPEFSGEIKEWQSFSDMFRTTVHCNAALSDVQRHAYLRSALSGEALALVTSLPLTGPNYSVCWDTLSRRYDNTHLQTNAHLEVLFSLPTTTANPIHVRTFAGKLAECVGALTALGHDVEGWAVPLLFLCTKRLHNKLRESWEERILTEPLPPLRDFIAFLHEQARILEAAYPSPNSSISAQKRSTGTSSAKASQSNKPVTSLAMSTVPDNCCPMCSAQHDLPSCGQFRRYSVPERIEFVKTKKLCVACLTPGHYVSSCHRKTPCKHCSYRHHSCLHVWPKSGKSPASPSVPRSDQPLTPPTSNSWPKSGKSPASSSAPRGDQPQTPPTQQLWPRSGKRPASPVVPRSDQSSTSPTASDHRDSVDTMQVYTHHRRGQVVVATAVAKVFNRWGKPQDARLLIDPGSQATFITRSCITRLGLTTQPTEVPVLGMGQTSLGICREMVDCKFEPVRSVELRITALVVDFITQTPSSPLPLLPPERLLGKKLADPEYHRPAAVDILLGAEWFGCVMVGEPQQGPQGTPTLIESIWGYCLIGRHGRACASVRSLQVTEVDDTCAALRRFWEVEEPPPSKIVSPEDRECEEMYRKSVSRKPNGRYVVALPFKPDGERLGDSRQAALRRFLQLEKRLSQNPTLRESYLDFMRDYLEQGHMRLAPSPPPSVMAYYIPHHCIYRTDAQGEIQKFRVVFDSSMATKDGPSLNGILFKGPKLQAEIVDILIRFRMYKVILIADVRQMYRNILVHVPHQDMQRILWRFNNEDPLLEYCLTTVTYGVSSSPFLAIRTLHQLVEDEGAKFPLAAAVLRQDTYMDDVVKSVSSLDEALELQRQLVGLMACAQFELRKWRSNVKEVLEAVPPEHRAPDEVIQSFENDTEPTAKILGLVWHSRGDTFGYQVSGPVSKITKRTIMAEVAKLYDPLGFICPVVFVGKCLLRQLWLTGVDWDDAPSHEICERWRTFQEELPKLSELSLPRCLSLDQSTGIQLHGFADSSESGYAGVVYLRSEFPCGRVEVALIMAKSRVAPVKCCTLPRLELCGVVLVTQLIQRVRLLIDPNKPVQEMTVWTDSMVALHWVTSSPHRWKTFIANRVAMAQSCVPPESYRHVPSIVNPADCASRGLLPSELLKHSMWFRGPQWLMQPEDQWPVTPASQPLDENRAEARTTSLLIAGATGDPALISSENVLEKYSSLTRLTRIVAWARRFIHNRIVVRAKGGTVLCGRLTVNETRQALAACVRLAQHQAFEADLVRLRARKTATKPLRRLAPFVDNSGIIRVGGRLRHAQLPDAQKFPIVLPRNHALTNLIIDFFHETYLHPGLSNLHAILLRSFWIVAGRAAIYSRISKCIKCFRTQPRSLQPPMADLPLERVNPGKPFAISGVDYAGPFLLTLGRMRKARVYKAYICLFVCFKTKAVHLELASELTTEAFLAALKRFVARRGAVDTLYSDCGTNFVGAKRQLESWAKLIGSQEFGDAVAHFSHSRSIDWQLNPPGSPHFGGLWEANVKSAKRLLARVIGKQLLTYEEFLTVLVQVEATLNSRPLIPLSQDPNDLQALTPGHFLFTEPPVALREPEVSCDRPARERWALLRQLVQAFWRRWSNSYLNTLQQRNKWTQPAPPLQEGMMVLIKEPAHTSPLSWKLGRVVRTIPGPDHQIRVAEVKTAHGLVRRSTVNLCPLPID